MNELDKALGYLDTAEAGVIELETLLTAIPALAPESATASGKRPRPLKPGCAATVLST